MAEGNGAEFQPFLPKARSRWLRRRCTNACIAVGALCIGVFVGRCAAPPVTPYAPADAAAFHDMPRLRDYERAKGEPACNWQSDQTVWKATQDRPLGPRAVWHCKPRDPEADAAEVEHEPPPIAAPGNGSAQVLDETVAEFRAHFDAIFDQTAALPITGNPAFLCDTECADGPFTEHWGAAFVSVAGHRHTRGYGRHVSLMSQSKVVAYILAIRLVGIRVVQQYVSAEPSGRGFGDMTTLRDHRAFNPFISTGAEVIWMLLVAAAGGSYKAAISLNVDVWEELSQGAEDGSELVVLKGEPYNDPPARAAIADLPEDPRELMGPGAERNENLAVLYVMAARLARMGGLPQRPPIEGAYQGFIAVNNLRLTPAMMATAAATLANGGVNPLTKRRVLSESEVRYALATMATAGLYDGSGRWMFAIGMPAKSGVGGGLLVVAPGLGGFASVSEALNEEFNPARGIAFFQALSMKFPRLHTYSPGVPDPNLSLRASTRCDLEASTVEMQPGTYVPDGWADDSPE